MPLTTLSSECWSDFREDFYFDKDLGAGQEGPALPLLHLRLSAQGVWADGTQTSGRAINSHLI